VNQETCRRIQALAVKHGYIQSPAVTAFMRDIRKGRISEHKYSLAYISSLNPDNQPRRLGQSLEVSMIAGAKAEANAIGCDLDIMDWSLESSKLGRLNDILEARGILGVFLGPAALPHTKIELDWEKFSVLLSGYTVEEPHLERIAADLYTSVIHAAEQAFARNYQRVIIAMSDESNERVGWRWLAAATCLKELYGADRIHIVRGKLTELARGVTQVIKPNTGIAVLGHDHLGSELRAAGLKFPDHIGFVGFDRNEAHPEQTAIVQPHNEIGRRAIQTLHALIIGGRRGIPEAPSLHTIECEWHEGSTLPILE
jgi:LacI family transcriptional regulator